MVSLVIAFDFKNQASILYILELEGKKDRLPREFKGTFLAKGMC